MPRFGFTGHQRGPQQEPDLYYAQQRWYNAATGRFISEDPLLGNPTNPPSLHRYLYAFANPVVFVDPDGRCPIAAGARLCFEQTADSLGVDPNTREGVQAVSEFERGQVRGAIKGAAELVFDTAQLASDLIGAPLELLSGNRLNFGATRRNDARIAGAVDFAKAPVSTIAAAIEQSNQDFVDAVESDRFGDAGEQTGRAGTQLGLGLLTAGIGGPSAALRIPGPPRISAPSDAPSLRIVGEAADGAPLKVTGGADNTVEVFRVFGGDARAQGFSFTPKDPRTISNFRDAAGLPSGGASGATNTADFLIKGEAKSADIIKSRSALPLDVNKGGLPELIIDPKNVNIIDFSVLQP